MEGTVPESYLTVAEVAELLKLNQQTVRNWIDQGSLPALRVGRRVRIRRSDLDRVLEAGSTVPGGASGAGGPSADDFWGGEPVGVPELEDGGVSGREDGGVSGPDDGGVPGPGDELDASGNHAASGEEPTEHADDEENGEGA